MTCFFIAGVVLLLNTWTGKRSGVTGNMDRDQADVQAIMDLLRFYERSWTHSGLFWYVTHNSCLNLDVHNPLYLVTFWKRWPKSAAFQSMARKEDDPQRIYEMK